MIKTRLEPGPGDIIMVSDPGAGCGDQETRGIMWREAGSGSVVTRPCPAHTEGVAVRECRGGGRGWGGGTAAGTAGGVVGTVRKARSFRRGRGSGRGTVANATFMARTMFIH